MKITHKKSKNSSKEYDFSTTIKKHFKNLNYKTKETCLNNHIIYQHPEHPKLKAIFPFITSYEDINRVIYSNILDEKTGIKIKSLLTKIDNIKSNNGNNSSRKRSSNKLELSKDIRNEIDFKLNSQVYELISSRTVFNTLNYLFQKISNGIYVQIKNGTVASFVPFINTNFINNWGHLIKLPKEYKNLDEYYQAKKKEFNTEGFKYLNNRDLWRASNCLIQTGPLASINDAYWAEMYNMIELTCQKHKVEDVEFFINLRHFPVLKNDFTEPFDNIFGNDVPLTSYLYTSYHPILSVSTNDNFGDLTYPSPDDWRLITKEFYRNDCTNDYINDPDQDDSDTSKKSKYHAKISWNNKKDIAYFRDDTSGCGTVPKNNNRLKLVEFSKKYPSLIDAKITQISERDKYNNELQFHTFNDQTLHNKSDNSDENDYIFYEKYKYIISIQGYGIDPKLPYYLSLGSLIFRVDGEYNGWYDNLLKPYKHYIPVKKDLSDLVSLIKWAKSHDQTAEKIARNAQIAFKKYFNQNTVTEYWSYLLKSISHKRLDTESLDEDFNKYKAQIKIIPHIPFARPITLGISSYKLGIIIPYYNENIEYKRVRNELVSHLVKMFKDYNELNYKIIIVEQYDDKSKFNKGQLVNLGLLIAKKHNCTHIVINNLRFKPTKPLIPYYLSFEQANKAPVHIGFSWLSKYKGHYLGKCALWNLNMLEHIGGYNMNIWGWGCSDAILYHRYLKYAANKKIDPIIYIPVSEEAGTNIYVDQVSPIQQHLVDGQYGQLKILLDWHNDTYDDITKLNKFLKKIIKKTHKKTITHSSSTSSLSKDTNIRYNKKLQLMETHISPPTEHYIFKLLNDIRNDLIY
jgi:hypothetical protein